MERPGTASDDTGRWSHEHDAVLRTPVPLRPPIPPQPQPPVIASRRSPTRALKLIGKRLIDIAAASLGLVLMAPLFLIVGLWIKLDSPGPVFFSQRRMGQRQRSFSCLKFRTMHTDAEVQLEADPELWSLYVANACKLPADRDPRITRAGRVLRRTSLDELPQVVNVLLGHMSLVGPRPVTATELTFYGSEASALLSMRPGITGAWATSTLR